MPQKSTTITTNIAEPSTALAVALETFKRLGWSPKYATDKVLIGYTPRTAFKWNDEITIDVSPNMLTITSRLIHNESFDLLGKNKKHIANFISAFDSVKASATQNEIDGWKEQLTGMGEETVKEVEKQVKDFEETDKVMNFSRSTLYLTYGIIAINTLIFILMVIGGVNPIAPTFLDGLKWGADYAPLTFGGEWWRLLTAVFIHFGIIHLVMNMYALYFIGSYLEPLLGKPRYIIAYLCAGIASSLISTLWNKDNPIVSAGASGAVFGMFGVFLALLTTNVVPKHIRGSILQSILIFVAYNVFYGFRENSGIDNAAHLGGLASGMAIGYAYYFSFRAPQKKILITTAVAVITIGSTFMVLQNNQRAPININFDTGTKYSKEEMAALDKFINTSQAFNDLEEKALAITNNIQLRGEAYVNMLRDTVLVYWGKAATIIEEAASPSLPEKYETLRKDYADYANKRIAETSLFMESAINSNDKIEFRIDSVQTGITQVLERINKSVAELEKEN